MVKESVVMLALLASIWVGGCQTQETTIPKLIQDLGRDTPSLRWMRTTPREIAKKKLGEMKNQKASDAFECKKGEGAYKIEEF